jgi:chromosome segregation ATPase
MSDGHGTIDLLNVDYEDVLHLYRGWRHAESQLKDKNKELASLKNRIKQLQESHTKFRGQIQALESVKELTVTLKTQLAALEEENKQLVIENSTLSEVNNQAEELLIEGETTTHKLSSQLNKNSLETAEYKGRCQQLLETQSELEKLLTEEQSSRIAAENRIKTLESTIEKLTSENRESKWKLDNSYTKIDQYHREIESASSHLTHLTQEISDMNTLKQKNYVLETEKQILKRDIIRLLRLLEHYPAGKGFLKQWQDSEGMSFVGTNRIEKEKEKTEYNLSYGVDGIGVDDSLSVDLAPITPVELAQLKRVHNVEHDTNLMFPTMEVRLLSLFLLLRFLRRNWIIGPPTLLSYRASTTSTPNSLLLPWKFCKLSCVG